MGREAGRCNKISTPYGIYIVTPQEGWQTKAEEAPSPHEVRLTSLDTNPLFQCLGGKHVLYDNLDYKVIFFRKHASEGKFRVKRDEERGEIQMLRPPAINYSCMVIRTHCNNWSNDPTLLVIIEVLA